MTRENNAVGTGGDDHLILWPGHDELRLVRGWMFGTDCAHGFHLFAVAKGFLENAMVSGRELWAIDETNAHNNN